MRIRYLTREELEIIHRYIALRYGFRPTIMLSGNLDQCVDNPGRRVYGHEVHPSLFEKAAALMNDIDKLHPFAAGNKRTAYEATDTFLTLNGFRLEAEIEEAVDISVRTASCTAAVPDVVGWIEKHAKRSAALPRE